MIRDGAGRPAKQVKFAKNIYDVCNFKFVIVDVDNYRLLVI